MVVKMEKMESIPTGANPFHHDLISQGIDINERFLAMFVSYNENILIIVDKLTGTRTKMIFPPAARVNKQTKNQIIFKEIKAVCDEREKRNKEHKGFSSWVDIKS